MKHDATPVAVHDVPPGHFQDNPWMGLAFYTEQNQSLFFGRQKESADLLRLLQRDTLTVLFGRSGMGKTSLLRAGLIPRLRQDTFFPVILRIDYADNALLPVEQVKALTIEAARISGIDVENLSACGPDATLWEFFHTVEFWGVRNDILTPVLIFDQFEELFTLCRTCSGAEEFTTQLADLVENRVPRMVIDRISESGERFAMDSAAPKYKVVLSLREDYVFRLDGLLPIMPAVMRNRLALHPLESERALEVILGAGGHWVAKDVARCIVAAVAGKEQEAQEPVAAVEIEPAYLSVMCHELFRRMQSLGIPAITQDLVAGEQSNILDGLYERSFEGLATRTRLFVEDHLLTPSGFRATLPIEDATREGVSIDELGVLVDRRLLRFEDRLGTRHVELSHDILTPVVQRRRDERREALARAEEQERQAALQQQLVRSRLQTAMALALAVVILGVGIFFWDYLFKEHVTYYKTFTKRFGVPVGVGENLSAKEVKHRMESIRITRVGRRKEGRVLSVEAVTPEGRLNAASVTTTNFFKLTNPVESLNLHDEDALDFSEKPHRWEIVYDSEGHVVYEIAKDRVGRMVQGIVYAPQQALAKEGGRSIQAMYVGPDGYPQAQAKSRAEYVTITYNGSGEESEIWFTDREGKPMPGLDRAFGYRNGYDEKGRLIRRTSFDMNRQPAADANGITTTTFQYDDRDNLVLTIYRDAEDRKTLHNIRGFAEARMDCDEWGNLVEVKYLDAYGKSAQDGQTTMHAIQIKWNLPYHFELTCFDTNMKPTGCIDNEIFAAKPMSLDLSADMNVVRARMHTNDTSLPVIEVRFQYDDRGFQQEEAYFDDKDQPATAINTEVHRVITVRDSRHLPVEIRLLDTTPNPVLSSEGYHLARHVFDKQGRIIEVSWFSSDDEPCENSSYGAHKVINRYDSFGNLTLLEYYGTYDNRSIGVFGFHQARYEYDEFGNKEHERYFDRNQDPVIGGENTNTCHHIVWQYDERGNAIAEEYFGVHDEPVEKAKGIHRFVMEYNKKNQEISRQYFGIGDTPAGDDSGVHLYRKVFNSQGQLIEETRLGMSGEGMYDPELGIATYRTKFDDEGRLIEGSYFDTSNHLAIGPYGNAKTVVVYKENERSETINFGTDDKRMFNPLYGHVSVRRDPRTRSTVIDTSYHGLDGILMFGPEGYAVQESTYDDKDRYIMRRWLGPDKEPVPGPQCYHRIDVQYTKSGTTEKTLDVLGKEISPQELARFPRVIQVSLEVTTDTPLGVKSPAAKAGMQTGDILWRYGDWSFPEAVAAEREKGTAEKNLLMEVFQAMTSERDKRSGEEVRVWVIRHGEPVRLTMPPLPEKLFGAGIQDQTVPPEVYETWRKTAEQALLQNQ